MEEFVTSRSKSTPHPSAYRLIGYWPAVDGKGEEQTRELGRQNGKYL